MPIYEYRCDNCGHELEAIQKISEKPMKTCPECKEDALVKKISAAGFRLKGGGWYETDFKSGKDKKKNLVSSSSSGTNSETSGSGSASSASADSSSASSSSSKSGSDSS